MFTTGKIILASASPRRRSLLESVGINVEVCPPELEEIIKEGESPQEFTQRVAREKAEKVLLKLDFKEDFWIISADTTVVCQGKVLNKPIDATEAKAMLSLISGKTHKVVTSFCVIGSKNKNERVETVESFVSFREMSDKEIDWYISTEEPLDKAGAYGAQGFGTIFIHSIDGSYTNVVGLPLSQLIKVLLEMGALHF